MNSAMKPTLSTPNAAGKVSAAGVESLAGDRQRLEIRFRQLTAHLALMESRISALERSLFFRWITAAMRLAQPLTRLLFSPATPQDTDIYRDLLDAQAWPQVPESPQLSRQRLTNLSVVRLQSPPPKAELLSAESVSANELGRTIVRNGSHIQPVDVRSDRDRGFGGPHEQVVPISKIPSIARSEFLLFFNPGYCLAEGALDRLRFLLLGFEGDLLYFDDDERDPGGVRRNVCLRPGWSPELLLSGNYLGGAICVRRETAREIGFRDESPAPLYDFALRLMEAGGTGEHVPEVLVHRPATPDWTALESERQVLCEAIVRREGVEPELLPVPEARCFHVSRPAMKVLSLTAIICSKSPERVSRCLETIRRTAGNSLSRVIVVAHEGQSPNQELRAAASLGGAEVMIYRGAFNFSAMNNLAAKEVSDGGFVFLNDDVSAECPGWARRLAEAISCPSIGIAGALLHYPNGTVQHAGITLGINDGAGHMGRFSRGFSAWPWLGVSRNVTAVTGACLAIPAGLFHEVRGFEEAFARNYTDVDLCLRVREAGYEVVCVAVPGLVHTEAQTREPRVKFHERDLMFSRWPEQLLAADRYHHPALTPTETLALNPAYDSGYRPRGATSPIGRSRDYRII